MSRRIAALAFAACALLIHVDPRTRAQSSQPDVILLGSSSVNGALGRLIETELERHGMAVDRRGQPSTGLSRPDYYDWQAQIGRLGDLRAMRGVIVYLGGNDAQAFRLRDSEAPENAREPQRWVQFRDEARWSEAYQRRVHEFVEGLCSAGARKVVVLPPIDGEEASHAPRIRRVQRLQIAGTTGTSCGVVADATSIELGPEHAGDGVHLNRAGARLVWQRIEPVLLGAFR